MANTEGLSDEAVSSLLTMPSPEEEKQLHSARPQKQTATAPARKTKQKAPAFPRRSLARREQMMELGEGETPAAMVIRSSRAPKIHSVSSTKKGKGKARVAEKDNSEQPPFDNAGEANPAGESNRNDMGAPSDDGDRAEKPKHKPVMSSDRIRERPMVDDTNSSRKTFSSSTTTSAIPRESRFKQRNRNKNGGAVPTVGGFPSLDIAPVGAFTRKGRYALVQDPPQVPHRGGASGPHESMPEAAVNRSKNAKNEANGAGTASHSMLANMSLEEIQDGVEEVQSILSAGSIAFLRKRGRQKQAESKKLAMKGAPRNHCQLNPPKQSSSLKSDRLMTKNEEIQLEETRAHEEKEKMAELLSSVRTPEDMDRVYEEALQLGIASELPASSLDTGSEENLDYGEGMNERLKNLHIATSLLRSTAPRQRVLGARRVCDILEEDVTEFTERRHKHSFSESCDEREAMRKKYPQLLPVAVRCLLDESIATFQTSGGRLLLSIVLRCIHALMSLFVHPYHAINVSPMMSTGDDDPFILYQTCFMSDVSHIPPGTELYPPTQIKPLDQEDTKNASCYRADSSAATAESDSKAFYNDPAWTLLSRMRMLPCLSDILVCLSTDYSTGLLIPAVTIQSICGILAMLVVRSPGAAGAIASHKGIIPFIVSYCLSPANGVTPTEHIRTKNKDYKDGNSDWLFNTEVALPALTLLCHLARQSRDIAALEMPFQEVIPDLLAILCIDTVNEKESKIQIWSLLLLRILMRYGLAIEHVQSLINIAAPRVEVMKPESSLAAHYLLLFANICDASKIVQQNENDQNMPTIPEAVDCLAMSGVWLSSSARNCAISFQTVVHGCGKEHIMLASSQLQLLSSYISTATPTMTASSIPIVSKESCLEVIDAALKSAMLGNALSIALGASYNAYWGTFNHSKAYSLEEEAIGCSFLSSFMSFVKISGLDSGSAFKETLFDKIIGCLERYSSHNRLPATTHLSSSTHPARQSWFIESEFSILNILCGENSIKDDQLPLLTTFAFSLVGRLSIGHEALAAFIFSQKKLFEVKGKENSGQSLQALFVMELLSENDRKLQLSHSSNLFMHGPGYALNNGSLNSLRCTADFVGGSNDSERETYFLPLGGIWMWNVLSSTINSDQSFNAHTGEDQNDDGLQHILSHTLNLLIELELEPRSDLTKSLNDGTKLYHTSHFLLLPEKILSNDSIGSALDVLFKRLTSLPESSLISDFIKACFQHSRISTEGKNIASKNDGTGATEKKLFDLIDGEQSLPDGYSKDELKALVDFVDDMCNAYIEYGGQYTTFTNFVRLFLRQGFPSKVISAVLMKLNPILHVLTIDNEKRDDLFFALSQSISGGLPSIDSSHRDPSNVLDSFSSSLKKRDKELMRNDYVYLLAVAVLSQNLAFSSHRCECSLEAMKNRLSGVNDSVFNDITRVSEDFLRNGNGTTADLITCVFVVCTESRSGTIKEKWNVDENSVWIKVVDSLKDIPTC